MHAKIMRIIAIIFLGIMAVLMYFRSQGELTDANLTVIFASLFAAIMAIMWLDQKLCDRENK